MGKLLVLCGPSGSGKSSLADQLPIPRLITATTRPPRSNEVNGVDYFFKTRKEFERMIEAGELVEHATYDGHLYGIPMSEVRKVINGDSTAAVVVELEGVKVLKQEFSSDVVVVHLDIDDDTLLKRLVKRGGPLINILNRYQKYKLEEQYEHFRPYADVSIRNSGAIEDAVKKLTNLMRGWALV